MKRAEALLPFCLLSFSPPPFSDTRTLSLQNTKHPTHKFRSRRSITRRQQRSCRSSYTTIQTYARWPLGLVHLRFLFLKLLRFVFWQRSVSNLTHPGFCITFGARPTCSPRQRYLCWRTVIFTCRISTGRPSGWFMHLHTHSHQTRTRGKAAPHSCLRPCASATNASLQTFQSTTLTSSTMPRYVKLRFIGVFFCFFETFVS